MFANEYANKISYAVLTDSKTSTKSHYDKTALQNLEFSHATGLISNNSRSDPRKTQEGTARAKFRSARNHKQSGLRVLVRLESAYMFFRWSFLARAG